MATDVQTRFHEEWLGLAQPYEGLVFSVPVLAAAQITPEVGADLTARFRRALVHPEGDEVGHIGDLGTFFEDFLGYVQPGALVRREKLPEEVHFYAQEGGQEIKPSFAISRSLAGDTDDLFGDFGDTPTPPAKSGEERAPYVALVWDVRDEAGEVGLGLDLDKPEELTGSWRYSPSAKFERLLRATGVEVGFLSNGYDIRLVYAPSGESTSHLTFRGEFMQRPDGRPILAALELLLNASRTYGASPEHTFEGLLRESRSRQADVTKELALQVFEAVEILLSGFEAASNRDSNNGSFNYLGAALEAPRDHAYQGVLSVVLRLVFLLYAEDQSLLPVQNATYSRHLSIKGLYDELVSDAGQHPESMNHRFGAYGRLLSLFRLVFFGVRHGSLHLPPRRGRLFDPNTFPFLEGGLPGTTAASLIPEERAATRPPSVDDGTVYEVLHRLIFFQGQRLSYATLDVEQLGSVYESLMGFHVLRATGPAVRLGKNRLWVELAELKAAKATDRKKLLKENAGLSTAHLKKVDDALKEYKSDDNRLLEALNELSPGGKRARRRHRATAGRLLLQPGEERRRSGSHYTPRSLTQGIVRGTLEPLLKCLGDEPTEEQLLSLKICDPAMGSGAFLVEVVRQLGQQVVRSWTRAGVLPKVAEKHANPDLHAMRLVAQRCVYGVDKNPAAVELAKLSLWLVTLSADLPFTFVDHALRHGDSLVGLNLDQVGSFHWMREKQLPMFQQVLKDSLEEALEHRAELLELAKDDSPRSQDERRRLLDHAEQATNRIRMVADVCVGAFFSQTKDNQRKTERVRRLDLVVNWLKGDASLGPQLEDMAREAREELSPFHWMLEFPEVFYLERPDPLDSGRVNGAAMMDGFVGNPPFMGGSLILGRLGASYRDWLLGQFQPAQGRSDICAHFFRQAANLLGAHGSLGFVATNSIAQGDTRATGLAPLLAAGNHINHATTALQWPGEANVVVTIVLLVRGRPSSFASVVLDGCPVATINSSLRSTAERAEPVALRMSEALCYQGNKLNGGGFVLSAEEWRDIVEKNPSNSEVVFPYLGGEEVNSSPTHSHHRYVINFGARTLEEAARWPLLLNRVRELVRPARDAVKDNSGKGGHGKKYWWQYVDRCEPLLDALEVVSQSLVCARVSKHLVFAFQPKGRVLSDALCVFALDSPAAFSVLQSRIHETWARLLSSSMRSDLRYTATDCFETFPFPKSDPRTSIPELESVGEKLYETRAKYMVDTDQGLTRTYNALKDPACEDPRIIDLRALHEEMDRAVLRAYPKLPEVGNDNPHVVGWSDIEVPHFCIATPRDHAALQAFEDKVIDRLFVLNEIRAKEEKSAKLEGGPKKGAKKKASNKKPSKSDDSQGTLF